jgi:hypothetical protein
MQWLQDPNQSNTDNPNDVRHAASRQLRNIRKEYLKAKIDELETNSKINKINDLNECISGFKKGYQSELMQ